MTGGDCWIPENAPRKASFARVPLWCMRSAGRPRYHSPRALEESAGPRIVRAWKRTSYENVEFKPTHPAARPAGAFLRVRGTTADPALMGFALSVLLILPLKLIPSIFLQGDGLRRLVRRSP